MASVLIFNDRKEQGDIQKDTLESAGHTVVEVVIESNIKKAVERLEGLLRQERDVLVDVLVLDIHIEHVDDFGGIWVHNRLRASCRGRWKHTIIFTKHVGKAGLRPVGYGTPEYIIRVFADSAEIPFENVLSNELDTQQSLAKRVKELVPWPA